MQYNMSVFAAAMQPVLPGRQVCTRGSLDTFGSLEPAEQDEPSNRPTVKPSATWPSAVTGRSVCSFVAAGDGEVVSVCGAVLVGGAVLVSGPEVAVVSGAVLVGADEVGTDEVWADVATDVGADVAGLSGASAPEPELDVHAARAARARAVTTVKHDLRTGFPPEY